VEFRDWSLHHHDNAPADSALSTHEFMAKNKTKQNITVLPYPPYPQYLALSFTKTEGGSIFNITTIQAELHGKIKFQT